MDFRALSFCKCKYFTYDHIVFSYLIFSLSFLRVSARQILVVYLTFQKLCGNNEPYQVRRFVLDNISLSHCHISPKVSDLAQSQIIPHKASYIALVPLCNQPPSPSFDLHAPTLWCQQVRMTRVLLITIKHPPCACHCVRHFIFIFPFNPKTTQWGMVHGYLHFTRRKHSKD